MGSFTAGTGSLTTGTGSLTTGTGSLTAGTGILTAGACSLTVGDSPHADSDGFARGKCAYFELWCGAATCILFGVGTVYPRGTDAGRCEFSDRHWCYREFCFHCTLREVSPQSKPDGSELQVAGRAKMPIILGLDFLRGHKCQLIWDEECFTVGHYRVPLQKRPEEPVICRVRLAENIVVPPSSEVFLECQVVSDDRGELPAWGVLQNRGALANDHCVLVTNALVETRDNRVPVRLLNPSSEAITIRKGTDAAILEPVD